MTDQIHHGSYVYYDLEDKHFWAAFLNLARHNVFLTINHIHERVGLKTLENDDQVTKHQLQTQWSSNFISGDLVKKHKLLELILRHFPFIEPAAFGKASYEEYLTLIDQGGKKKKGSQEKFSEQSRAQDFTAVVDILLLFVDTIHHQRNFYSHYKHYRPVRDFTVFRRLDDIFDANINLVKKDHSNNSSVDNHRDFEHLIRKNRNGLRSRAEFKYYFYIDNNFNRTGLLFFTSLFLSKKDAIWMQKKIYGFKGGDESWKRMTNEVFCRSRVVIPKLRLKSNYTQDQLLLDMLNELARCPKTYYQRLQASDQAQFHVKLEEYEIDDYASEEDQEEQSDPFVNTLIRHQDRFPYFSLRYLDIMECFKGLRFQIDLGNYHYHIYEKKIAGVAQQRHMIRTLTSFGRLQYFEEHSKPESWAELVKDLDYYETSDLPFISKTRPHYHFQQNKIGLRFYVPRESPASWPSIETKDRANSNEPRKGYALAKQHHAEAFLSTHELLPLMFYWMLTSASNNSESNYTPTEQVLKRTYDDILETYAAFEVGNINSIDDLNHFLEDKNILAGSFPKHMLRILKGEPQDMIAKAKRKLGELIKDTEARIQRVKNQINQEVKIGKRKGGLMKSGKIADWLVKDMMRFQPIKKDEDGSPIPSSKANATEFQLLQRTLALFGGEKDKLPLHLQQCNLIGSENNHAFLKDFAWSDARNILSFYHGYLYARLNFLVQQNPKDWKKSQYFLLLNEPKHDRSALVKGWKQGGINLPRGIFTEPIRMWLISNGPEKIKDQVEQADRVGFIPMVLPLYFDCVHDDGLPSYYDLAFNIGDPYKPKSGLYTPPEERKKLWSRKKSWLKKQKDFRSYDQVRQEVEKLLEAIKPKRIKWNAKKEAIKNFFDRFEDLPPRISRLTDGRLDLNRAEKEILAWIKEAWQDFRSWQHFERKLRLYKNQDILVWLMSRELHSSDLTLDIKGLKLKNLNPDPSSSSSLNVLNRVSPMRLMYPVHPVVGSQRKLKHDEVLFTVYIEEKGTKILNHGNFKALLKDRRLNNLFTFVHGEGIELQEYPISYLRIKRELDCYQRVRVGIFEQTLELEKNLLESDGTLPNAKFRKMLDEWKKSLSEPLLEIEEAIDNVVAIRNAFSHNQYPTNNELRGINLSYDPKTPNIEVKDGLGVAIGIARQLGNSIDIVKKYIKP